MNAINSPEEKTKIESIIETTIHTSKTVIAWIKQHPKSSFTIGAILLLMATCGTSESQDNDLQADQLHEILLIDELAADPNDPERMSKGVISSDIIPKRAIMAGIEAIEKHPKVPRFHYQLGRSYEAAKDYNKAFESYKMANRYGYLAAKCKLAEFYANGTATEVDFEKTKQLIHEINAKDKTLALTIYNTYFFRPTGFSNPADMEALYTGQFNKIKTPRDLMIVNLLSFAENYVQKPGDFSNLFTNEAVYALESKGKQAAIGQAFGVFLNRDIDSVVSRGLDIKNDSDLFYQRYGDKSYVTKTMFKQIGKYAQGLEGFSILGIAEEEFYRGHNK